jgi:outer membrane protein
MTPSSRRFTARLAPLALAVSLAPASAMAEVIPGIDINGQLGYWGAQPNGTVSTGGGDIDLEDDLNFDRNGTNMLQIAFEHPVPLVPNVRLRHVSLDDSADGEIQQNVTYDNVNYQDGDNVRSSYDLEMTDATFYYSPLDNWVSLDLGLTARQLDARTEIDGSSRNASASADVVVPMGFLGVRVDAPMTGVYGSAEINAISADDNHLRDVRAVVGWQPVDMLALELGYQEMSLEIDDDSEDLGADMDFSGPFASATLRF